MKLTGGVIVVCWCMILFAACKKNDDDNKNLSPTGQTLVAGKWQLSGITATVNYMGKDTTADMYSQEDACKKDDVVTFASNGKVNQDEGANICPGHSQTSSFPWALLENDTRLALVDSNPDTFAVEITSTQMKLKQIIPNSSGMPVTYLYTYKNIK